MVIGCNFRFASCLVVLFSLFGILHAKATSDTDIGHGSKHSRISDSKSSIHSISGKNMGINLPDIIVKEDPSGKSSFKLQSPKKEEQPFSPIKRRKAIRNKVNEVYSKNSVAKSKDNKLGVSYLPDRARGSITRSMHQIVVEKEKGLKPKIEYKSVKYTMMPEETGNEIQTSVSKTDPFLKESDFQSSVSKFLIKRKYLIGSLTGKDKDKTSVQYILDGQTVFNDKYITSTADPIGFKQKSDQTSLNKLEEVKLFKSKSSKKPDHKELDSKPLTKERSNAVSRKENIEKTKNNKVTKENHVKNSPITKYDKMSMRDKLIYSQRFNEKKPRKGAEKLNEKVQLKSETSNREIKKEKYVTRRKTIRPKQEEINTTHISQNVPMTIEVDTKDWKTNYKWKKKKVLDSVMKSKGKVHIISKGKKSKELKVNEVNKADKVIYEKRKLYESQPLNIEIDTKDWKTNYRKKKNKLLSSMLDSTSFNQQHKKDKSSKAKTIKEVVQQRNVHSFLIKPNTVIEVGNTEITVGVPSHVALQSQTIDRQRLEQNDITQKKTEIEPPATYRAFRSDEIRKVINRATVANTDKINNKKKKMQRTTTSLPPTIQHVQKTAPLAQTTTTTTPFPLKIEFVTAKVPADVKTNENKSRSVAKQTAHKKFITNGLSEDPKKSRIITSSENLNVNLDHYADFTRTGITNGENNIVVGTLSGIKDRANAGMLNLNIDTAEREQSKNVTQNQETSQKGQLSSKVTTNGSKVEPFPFSNVNTKTTSKSETRLSNAKRKGKSMTDFSISLLAAHEVEKTTNGSVQKRKPSTKAPVKKSPRFVIRNNKNNGKSFVFSFKSNKKPTIKIPKVPSVQFQPAFIYKDTAEIHRSENSLYVNSIHDKPEKTNTFYKHNVRREKHKDFRWPVPSSDRVQGIPVTQPPPEVSTLGMIISGDFVSSFAEQAFKDLSSSNKAGKQNSLKYSTKSKLQENNLVKNDFLFPMQSLYTPSPKAITTVDLALATKRRNGLYENDNFYSSDIHKQIKQLLNSTETIQLTDIPGNIEIQTSTVAIPNRRTKFTQNRPNNVQFVYTAETQAGQTRMQKISKPKDQLTLERTTFGNGVPASITGYDIGLSLKRDKSKKTYIQMTPATRAFKETPQSPVQNVYKDTNSLSSFNKIDIPSKFVETVILPTVETRRFKVPLKPITPKTKPTTTPKTTTTTTTTTTTPQPTSTTQPTTERVTTKQTEATTTTTIKTTKATATIPTSTTTTTTAPTKAVLSKLSNVNHAVKKANDALARINEIYRGPPDNIIAVSKTDAFKKYKKAATEVIEMKKSPTMVPAVGIIKPLRKSEAIYKFSQYGSKQKQDMVEDNAIKREIKKLLIQQNTVYPAPIQNGPVSLPRVTPMIDQYMYAQNDMASNGRGILYNTPEMTSMMIATESVLPEKSNPYIQNYNFPGANHQALGNSARYPYQTVVRVTPPTAIVQPKVYQPQTGPSLHHRLSWTTVLPSGSTMDEFAIVKDDEMVIFLVSDQTPPHSRLDKSSTLLDFTVGHMAMRFNIDGTNGQICFVTHTSAKFQNTKEALQSRALSQVVRLADPIQLYAELTTHVPQHDLHRVGGSAFYKFCKVAIKQDNIYELVMEPTGNVGPMSFTGSGLVYPSEPGLSVPIKINVESMIDLKKKHF